jgi:hypothetical protein
MAVMRDRSALAVIRETSSAVRWLSAQAFLGIQSSVEAGRPADFDAAPARSRG